MYKGFDAKTIKSIILDNLDLFRVFKNDLRSAFIHLDFPPYPNRFIEIVFLRLEWELPKGVLKNGETHIPGEIPVEIQEAGLF